MAQVQLKATKQTYDFKLTNSQTYIIERELKTLAKEDEFMDNDYELMKRIVQYGLQSDEKMTEAKAVEFLDEMYEDEEMAEKMDKNVAIIVMELLLKDLWLPAKGVKKVTPRAGK